MSERGIRAGLDVFAQEPDSSTGDFTDPIVQLPGVYGTHHVGASTDQAQEAIAAEAVRIVLEFGATGAVPNVVNLAKTTPAVCTLVVRHYDRPGVLARTLEAVRAAGINVQEMSNTVFDGSQAAVARISLEQQPQQSVLDAIRADESVIEVSLVEH